MSLTERPVGTCTALISDCPPGSDKRWSSTTLDLTLADEVRPWQPQGEAGADVIIDPSDPLHRASCAFTSPTRSWLDWLLGS